MAHRTFEQLMKAYPAPVVELARQARAFVFDMMGDKARESVDTTGPYVFYSYAPGYKGLVCSLLLSKKGVKLGLAHSAELDDPHKLLEGAGNVHKHIALETPADLRKPGIRPLVKAAIKATRFRNSS